MNQSKVFLLVSPGPVDGYPPVQYQARLLAKAGHQVTLVTTSLTLEDTRPAFACPGVTVRYVPAGGRRETRMMRFGRALWSARRALPGDMIEIAYDPIGIFYSDFVPGRPPQRVAHLHELLQNMDSFVERRLKGAASRYTALVVPDSARAVFTQRQLSLTERPLVVENYPLRADSPLSRHKSPGARFEVVYCGSLGLHQKLDQVVRSIPLWPEYVDLVLIGKDTTPIALELRAMTEVLGIADRVHFLGWMDTADAERRVANSDLGLGLLEYGDDQWRTALGASNKRYQYMKAGLPQVGDDNPGVPELLDGIGTCLKTHEPTEIAGLVTAYANDPERCAIEGARAFERHQGEFNYERVFQKFMDWIID
tara:strand:- start:583 stop:1683 length:1101 start_codon:yes stop_codon:yes gene_type:complete